MNLIFILVNQCTITLYVSKWDITVVNRIVFPVIKSLDMYFFIDFAIFNITFRIMYLQIEILFPYSPMRQGINKLPTHNLNNILKLLFQISSNLALTVQNSIYEISLKNIFVKFVCDSSFAIETISFKESLG